MIRHVVLIKTSPDVAEATAANIFERLAEVVNRLSGAKHFAGGRSESPEQLVRGYTHGFTIDFDDWDALATYAESPDHKALGAQLVKIAEGGIDGILVVDLPLGQG